MDNEARLMRALAGSAAPRRDPAFTIAVMRAAEDARFRAETARSVLRSAAVAAAIAALALPLTGWVLADGEGLRTAVLSGAALLALIAGTRLMVRRTVSVLAR
jgi:anti-sigma factor RsiW